MAPELITAEEAARLYLTSRADELTKQMGDMRSRSKKARLLADQFDAEADALRNELQGITAIKAAILEES